MSDNTVSIELLGRSLKMKCAPDHALKLKEAGEYLNKKMLEMNTAGSGVIFERAITMAAINVAYELIALRGQKEDFTQEIEERVNHLRKRIEEVLNTSHLDLPKPLLKEQQSFEM
jgi:cell division protein ZapA (FtsZ GTPase activity inhibitor)